MEAPPIRYATSNGYHLAYQGFGDGPVDIVLVAGWLTHLEVLWENRDAVHPSNA